MRKFISATTLVLLWGMATFESIPSASAVTEASSGVSLRGQRLVAGSMSVEPMTVTGFDDQVATAHGYRIVRLPDGRSASIRQDVPLSGDFDAPTRPTEPVVGPNPTSIVYGNCGSSYFYLYNVGYPKWKVLTGYTVAAPVADILDWQLYLYDPHGSIKEGRSWSGIATGAAWQVADGPPPLLTVHGTYHGLVADGTVVLVNGAICTSGHPADWQSF
jgi:hypothetical protein